MEKILHYNNFTVSEIFKRKDARRIFSFLGNPKVFGKYKKFRMNLNAVYDRSGSIPHYLNMSDMHPMPKYDSNFNKSFIEVSTERAKELLALGKPIKVCWSGGLDSMFVLYTLLEHANDKSQVEIYGTYSSIIESGDVFDKYIKGKVTFKLSIFPTEDVQKNNSDCIWVTGFQGNHLFGPTDNFFDDGRPTVFFHHTMGTPKTIYEDYKKYIDQDLLEFLQPAIDASPRKIETVADLRWYCIFNMDWYNGLYHMKGEMVTGKMDRIHHFFNSENFQKWAITTKEPWTKVPGNPNTHRWQMREYLKDNGLVDYSKNKSKAISCFFSHNPQWCFLLDNNENVYI